MSFKPEPKPPQFADLKGMLAQSKQTDNALNQTLTILIDRLDQLEVARADVVQRINNSVNTITSYVTYLTNNTATYLTTSPEEVALANSSQLLPGANIVFDASVPHRLTIHSTGGGGTGGGMNLDYLGDYVGGPVYNDGDIVIGADGVAYMCVVDGTTTPPEPWPGTGAAVNIGLDATYWTVSPHTGLTNERALSLLGNGYVKSTAGEPSVVPSIPPGDLPPYIAYTNIDNHFVAQTFASFSRILGTNGALIFADTAAPVNNTIWRQLGYGNGNFYVEALTDDYTVIQTQFYFRRDGYFGATGFIGNGSNLTALNATNLTLGTVPLARLGTNAPTGGLFLAGDNTWKTPGGIPSGLIVLSTTACPVGWTRITAWDGRYIRVGPGGLGGSASHGHTFTTDAGGAHNHTGETNALGDHTHGFGVHTLSGTESAGTMNVDAGQSGNMSRGLHQHGVDYDGNTGTSGFHSHQVNLVAAAAHAHTGGTNAANNDPLYVDLWLCQKD